MAQLRKLEGETACEALGIDETEFLGFEAIADDDASKQATKQLIEIVNRFEPDEVYTLHPELDRHASHRAAGKITIDALDQTDCSAEAWAYEVWGLFPSWDRLEDISDHLETKLGAIKEHRSQVAAIEYDEGIAGLNRWRGVFADPHQQESPARYAEVFIKLR
jgi:LmbE family N-acetylglucosaminyl deacetylase